MATLQAFPITQTSNIFTDNQLPQPYTFDILGTTLTTSGTGSAQLVPTTPFAGDKCLKITNQTVTSSDYVVSLSGSAGNYTVPEDGRYIFSWWFKNPSYNASSNNGEIRLYKDALLLNIYYFDSAEVYDEWLGFWFDIILEAGDVINMQFVFADKPSSAVSNEYIYFDGFGMYFTDRDMPNPPRYEFPVNYKSNGSVINNSTDTISLTGSTDNLIQIQPDADQYMNGNLPLLDLDGKVTPTSTGETLSIDIRFTTVAPTTDAAVVYAKFKVSGQVQRQERFVLSNTNGAEEVWNLSFSMTVTDSGFGDTFNFLDDGGLFYLNPSENINVKNCRIEVARTVRGL